MTAASVHLQPQLPIILSDSWEKDKKNKTPPKGLACAPAISRQRPVPTEALVRFKLGQTKHCVYTGGLLNVLLAIFCLSLAFESFWTLYIQLHNITPASWAVWGWMIPLNCLSYWWEVIWVYLFARKMLKVAHKWQNPIYIDGRRI